MFNKIKNFLRNWFHPINTAWYCRPTLCVTKLDGNTEIIQPRYQVYGSETPLRNWEHFVSEAGVLDGVWVVAAFEKVEVVRWEDVCIKFRGSSFRVFDFPRRVSSFNTLVENEKIYDYWIDN